MKKEIKVGDKVKTRNVDLLIDGWINFQNSIIEHINKSNTKAEYGMKVYIELPRGKISKRKELVYLYRCDFTLR